MEVLDRCSAEMPKVQKSKDYRKTYSEVCLQRALEEFRLGPNFKKVEPGHKTYLTKDEENKIVEWILDSQKKGFPRRHMDIQLSVKAFIDADNRPTPFKDNMPGNKWFKLFCKVIAPKGCKNVYEVEQGDAKQNLTVMFSFSAAGIVTPPLVVYPNKRLPRAIIDKVPDDWGIGTSDNGWMKGEVFIDYIKNVFYPYLKKTNIEFPVILFLDGHKSHLSYQLSQLCSELQIILIALYPNCTRILQPADVGCFKPLKSFWKTAVADWRPISSLKPETLINGFRACGLQPWNPDALDFSKCLGTGSPNENDSRGQHSTRNSDEIKLNTHDISAIIGSEKIEEQHSTRNSDEIKLNTHDISAIIGSEKIEELKGNNENTCEKLTPQILQMPILFSNTHFDDSAQDPKYHDFPVLGSPESNNVVILENRLISKPHEIKSKCNTYWSTDETINTQKTEINQESVLQSIHEQSPINNHLCKDEFYKNNNTSDLLPENLADFSAGSQQEINEVPRFDENQHHEQTELLGSPSIKNIDMYLLKASTPKRKGKRQTCWAVLQ
ncbi:DDE superfamily endonuclease [Popillia japonica]|uniref:DDE superfamily endonuclease n=1 Tax=Popillia japonica TaxID=7064 RepID=A0AAW1NA75_POPJA